MLIFKNKLVRAEVLRDYAVATDNLRCVCFTCGNAAEALRMSGLDVIEVGPRGPLVPSRWWTPADIRRTWPDRHDFTSGHLPVQLMRAIGQRFKEHLGDLPQHSIVPTGSGETLVSLAMAYPDHQFTARYNLGPETAYNVQAPLNRLVEMLAFARDFGKDCHTSQDAEMIK